MSEVTLRTLLVGTDGSDTAAVASGLLRDVKRQYPDAPLRAIAREGDPVEVILGVAAEEGADVIVVGNRGMTGKRVLGGIPDKVTHHAPCHVLVADTNWAAILPTGEDPHAQQPVGRILVATDGSPTADVAVGAAADLARALPAELHLLHVGEEAHGRALLERAAGDIEDVEVHRRVVG